MKFLLEFVSCCPSLTMKAGGSTGQDEEVLVVKETRPLVTMTRRSDRRKRGRAGPSCPGDSGWKPTLDSISEDVAVVVVASMEVANDGCNRRVVKMKGGGGGRRGSGGGVRDAATIPGFCDDYRGNRFTMIPTFSATPFMI